MKLRPIDDCNSVQALAVLTRGFPEKSESFWAEGLQKILASPSRHNAEPVGCLMEVGGEDVGVVLTIPGQRPVPGGTRNLFNLAAWYVDEPHRWLAPRMLQKVVAQDAVFTDLTPSAAAQAINPRLGFEILNEGFQVFPLLWTALRPRQQARVISVDEARAAQRNPRDTRSARQTRLCRGGAAGRCRIPSADLLSNDPPAPSRRAGDPDRQQKTDRRQPRGHFAVPAAKRHAFPADGRQSRRCGRAAASRDGRRRPMSKVRPIVTGSTTLTRN